MSSRVAAVAVGFVALLAFAWFALGAVQAIATNRATALLSDGPLGPHRASEVQSLLQTAGRLNPDQNVNLLRAQLAAKQGHVRQARQIFLSVTHAEPENLQAWLQLAYHSQSTRYFLLALARVNRLLPPVGHARQ